MSAPTISFDLTITRGDAIRLAFLQSHYRSIAAAPDENKITECMGILRRWALACDPNFDGPPLEIVETLCNDLNTPGAIALLHGYRKRHEGRKLWAALKFLGFFGQTCVPDEIKTLPEDHPFQADYIGPMAVGKAQ